MRDTRHGTRDTGHETREKLKRFTFHVSLITSRKGFTFIELLVAASVIAILIAFLLAGLNPIAQIKKGRDAKRKRHLQKIQNALEDYYNDNDYYPKILVSGADFQPYLPTIPTDPKNEDPYVYYYETDGSPQPGWYKIYARLEYEPDPVIEKIGCAAGCGPDNSFNYFASSPNVYF